MCHLISFPPIVGDKSLNATVYCLIVYARLMVDRRCTWLNGLKAIDGHGCHGKAYNLREIGLLFFILNTFNLSLPPHQFTQTSRRFTQPQQPLHIITFCTTYKDHCPKNRFPHTFLWDKIYIITIPYFRLHISIKTFSNMDTIYHIHNTCSPHPHNLFHTVHRIINRYFVTT